MPCCAESGHLGGDAQRCCGAAAVADTRPKGHLGKCKPSHVSRDCFGVDSRRSERSTELLECLEVSPRFEHAMSHLLHWYSEIVPRCLGLAWAAEAGHCEQHREHCLRVQLEPGWAGCPGASQCCSHSFLVPRNRYVTMWVCMTLQSPYGLQFPTRTWEFLDFSQGTYHVTSNYFPK